MNDAATTTPSLMLLAPSIGFGGGIERVAHAIEFAWTGPVVRIDLYRSDTQATAEGAPWAKAAFAARAITAARRRRPAVVLALHVGVLPVAVIAARAAGGRSALFAFGTEVWAPMPVRRAAMVRGCSNLLSVSAFSARMLAGRAGMPLQRVALVPGPITPAFAEAARRQVRTAGARARQLVTVSRLDPTHRYKGHFEVAGSFGQVLKECPDARWVVVGDGRDLRALQAECHRLDIAESVDFAPHTTDAELAQVYEQACGLVLPSVADVDAVPPTGEGFGLVYAEAGAFGVPSIASTAAGGGAELVVDGHTGLTVAPGDRAALAHAMIRLLTDERLRERLGDEARRQVLANHTPKRFAAALHAALVGGVS